MAFVAMTTAQSIFLFVAVTLVRVHGRLNPADSIFTNYPQIPTNAGFFRKSFPESTTHIESQLTNLDESSELWASTRDTQDEGGFKQPRGLGVTKEYNYAVEADTSQPSDGFFTPEQLAGIRAFNEAPQAKLDRESMQNYQERPVTTSGAYSQYPEVLPDGTELLWVTGPEHATPEEMARLGALVGNPAGKSTVALPGSHRNEVQDSADAATDAFTVEYSSSWEDGPWRTQHRPGADHSLEYVGSEQRDASNGALPASHNAP